ncbi:MAG: hypothetical protein OEL83_09785 [Desulforhopalus sp.]|nr:hypothetical protein [Desulforhopalus sp.]
MKVIDQEYVEKAQSLSMDNFGLVVQAIQAGARSQSGIVPNFEARFHTKDCQGKSISAETWSTNTSKKLFVNALLSMEKVLVCLVSTEHFL